MPKNTLSKNERLKSQKLIDSLFRERRTVKAYPFIVVYRQIQKREVDVIFGISVSKRNFKRAVDRNRIKRLSREVYRTHKYLLSDLKDQDFSVAAMFIYVGKELPDYEEVKKGMKKAMLRLTQANVN